VVDVAGAAAGVGAAAGQLVDQGRGELDDEAVALVQAAGQLGELLPGDVAEDRRGDRAVGDDVMRASSAGLKCLARIGSDRVGDLGGGRRLLALVSSMISAEARLEVRMMTVFLKSMRGPRRR
jgi:hypothetical protein